MSSATTTLIDATEQARKIVAGEASSVELTSASIDAAHELNPSLNAIIHERYERAMADARRIDDDRAGGRDSGLLAGVPIVVKDLDGVLAGEPYHGGSQHLKNAGYVAPESSVLIQRFIDAGAVIIAKTNTPELGLVPSTEPVAYGPTHNPWDVTRSPAGSSGGSAAAVAAGIVAVGHAGDGGGSIRLPASVCGLVPTFPDIEPWGGLVARLAVTRTVRDTALVMDAVAAPDPLDPYRCRGAAFGGYRSVLDGPVPQLRIGVAVESPDGTPVDSRIVEVVQRTAAVLSELGHRVDPGGPEAMSDPDFFGAVVGNFLTVYPVWVAESVAGLEQMSGVAVSEESVEAHTWALAQAGRETSGLAFQQALTALMGSGRRIRQWWVDGNDLLLTPTVGELPWTLGQFGPEPGNPLAAVFRSSPLVGFMTPFNISGQPAISVPVGMVDGLPVGVQLVAAWGRDDQLLAVARQLEQAMPWADRRPSITV